MCGAFAITAQIVSNPCDSKSCDIFIDITWTFCLYSPLADIRHHMWYKITSSWLWSPINDIPLGGTVAGISTGLQSREIPSWPSRILVNKRHNHAFLLYYPTTSIKTTGILIMRKYPHLPLLRPSPSPLGIVFMSFSQHKCTFLSLFLISFPCTFPILDRRPFMNLNVVVIKHIPLL